ncbi:hypothetical protein CDAR_308251 [Caerostris darwini]|uniref:Uncharacterized protein n=1 Tax=Caerostris darwini TaxID=1538125 RepID=A0AAV4SCV6_9ARAC|nr:hypothetical protein CDAR_308251 [Caerostris darwini]
MQCHLLVSNWYTDFQGPRRRHGLLQGLPTFLPPVLFLFFLLSNSGVMNSGVNARLPLSGMSASGRKVMLNHFCLVPYWMLVSVMYLVLRRSLGITYNRGGTV